MKIFWSWQSDTLGKTGRHFVRDALRLAIEALKQAPDVEEPTTAAARDEIHLDQDRQGVTDSPDLARTIFEKIDRSAVFVADVTLVGVSDTGSKRLINSNVAIEYGHAHHALGDEAILMVQNAHYGDREELPFDLKHKAGPIQYRLAPDAKKSEIEAEQKKLVAHLVSALRPYLERRPPRNLTSFEEAASTTSPAVYFQPGETLGRIGTGTQDEIEYHFAGDHVFYLRVMPGTATPPLKQTELMDITSVQRPDVLSLYRLAGHLDRNRYGVVAIEPSGTSTVPRGLTQLFPSGEVWGISTHLFKIFDRHLTISFVAVENVYRRVLANYCDHLSKGIGLAPPFTIVLGAVGLRDTYVRADSTVNGPIHTDNIEIRRVLSDFGKEAQETVVRNFVDAVLDLAGVRRQA